MDGERHPASRQHAASPWDRRTSPRVACGPAPSTAGRAHPAPLLALGGGARGQLRSNASITSAVDRRAARVQHRDRPWSAKRSRTAARSGAIARPDRSSSPCSVSRAVTPRCVRVELVRLADAAARRAAASSSSSSWDDGEHLERFGRESSIPKVERRVQLDNGHGARSSGAARCALAPRAVSADGLEPRVVGERADDTPAGSLGTTSDVDLRQQPRARRVRARPGCRRRRRVGRGLATSVVGDLARTLLGLRASRQRKEAKSASAEHYLADAARTARARPPRSFFEQTASSTRDARRPGKRR